MNSAKQIDMAITKTADESSQLSDTIGDLSTELAALIQQEYPDIGAIAAFKAGGDAVAAAVEAAPRICANIAKEAGVKSAGNARMSRAATDKFLRQQPVIDAIARAVLRKARAYSGG